MELKDHSIFKKLASYQKKEITEHLIYSKLAKGQKNQKNREILERIGSDELAHYEVWKSYTKKEIAPSKLKICLFLFICKLFGLTFGIKLLERGEEEAQKQYDEIKDYLPNAERIIKDEHEHEEQLINLIDEERLKYVGSIVLGLSDALVELTGCLAGLTLALQKTSLVALSGLVVGVSAALSMAVSEYLSTKAEEGKQNPLKSAVYTGIVYIVTVLFLVFPFLILSNPYFSLLISILIAISLIAIFNFYVSVAKDKSFFKPFIEMALMSLAVAGISFGVGYILRETMGINI